MNSRFLKALYCEKVDRPPVWIMRQSGRYLPEYRKIRQKYPLKELFFNPDLATELTLLPLQRYPLDAAIVFSDILVVARAFGLELDYVDKVGPVVTPKLKSAKDVDDLLCLDVEETLSFVGQTIFQLQKELTVPLIGFCGGPFTVASYLIESGQDLRFSRSKKWMYKDPISYHKLMQKLTSMHITYLRMQQNKGVNAIQIFESWAHVLSEELFCEFCLPYLKQMIKAVSVPVILFVKGGSSWIDQLSSTRAQALSFDWQRSLSKVAEEVPSGMAIQGNFDPDLLYAPHLTIQKIVTEKQKEMEGRDGWIVNLGHGIKPDMSVESVQTFIEALQDVPCSTFPL